MPGTDPAWGPGRLGGIPTGLGSVSYR